MEGHLVVIIHLAVLFVGHFQRGLGDVVHLRERNGETRKHCVRKLELIRQEMSNGFY